jgi:2-C-methyl-D-erythritol 4-phosphate cytidylyltransferase
VTSVAAIIVAGGSGERFGRSGGKQLLEICGLPVMSWALRAFDAVPSVGLLVVVTHPERVEEYAATAVDPLGVRAAVVVVAGGVRRQDSVAAGLAEISDEFDLVAIHDGARPLVTPEVIASAIAAMDDDSSLDGVVVGHPATDTLKVVDHGIIVDTADRSRYWHAQTPQVFRTAAFRNVMREAELGAWDATDDAALVERAGGRVGMVEGPRDNLKVTMPEDAAIVEALLRWREGEGG